MKKKFKECELEVLYLSADIITTSGFEGNNADIVKPGSDDISDLFNTGL